MKSRSRLFSIHVLGCGLLLCTACSITLIEKPGARALSDGLNFERQGKTTEAAKAFAVAMKTAQDVSVRARALFEHSQLAIHGDGLVRDVPGGMAELEQSATLGNTPAIFQLAEEYRLGTHIAPDPEKAAALYRRIAPTYPAAGLMLAEMEKSGALDKTPMTASPKALIARSLPTLEWQAEKGSVGAMVQLANAYRDSIGVPQDAAKAEMWYRKAIALGNDSAAVDLANLWLVTGHRIHLGPDTAKLLAQAARAGNVMAMTDLAQLEEEGIQGSPDHVAAVRWYTLAAEHGNANAMAALGKIYLTGVPGVAANPAQGIIWLNKAIAAGALGAYTDLAEAYMTGIGVPQDQAKAIAYLNQAIKAGSYGALVALGNAYRDGTGVAKDPDQAVRCYQQALDNHIPMANFELGRMYLGEMGLPADPPRAFHYFSEAAHADVIGAARALGDLYAAGSGVAKDPAQAAKWYEIAVRQADRYAMVALGEAYASGNGVPKDEGKAAALYAQAADLGSVQGMIDLARAYHTGAGVPKDDAKAALTVDRILAVDPTKMISVGNLYARGEVVATNPPKAFSLYMQALASNPSDIEANHKMAECYERGFGTPMNYPKAFESYLRVAKAGDVSGMSHVARDYEIGKGVDPDQVQALLWRRKAANAGDGESMVRIAQLYAFGSGVDADMHQSLAWYQKAATAGNAEAQYQLGVTYARGVGVTRDVAKARMWLGKAKVNGYPIADQVLQTLLQSSGTSAPH